MCKAWHSFPEKHRQQSQIYSEKWGLFDVPAYCPQSRCLGLCSHVPSSLLHLLLQCINKSLNLSFLHWHATRFSLKHIALKVDVSQDWKLYCLQVHLCIIQPVNFTGWGSGGIKLFASDMQTSYLNMYVKHIVFVICGFGMCFVNRSMKHAFCSPYLLSFLQ